MSLLLCSQEYARRPYYVELLGIHLFTAQELSYVIYHYPLLVLDGFINDDLLEFLREELNLGMLSVKLERWLKRQENLDEALVLILQECGYYNGVEINRFRQRLMDLRKKHPAEFSRLKADELFSMHQYTRAAQIYEELLDRPADKYVDDAFLVKVLNNLGACHAQTFHFARAYEAYEKAYLRIGKEELLQRMYLLTLLDEKVRMGEHIQAVVTQKQKEAWAKRLEAARDHAARSDGVARLEALFKKDSIRRQAGQTEIVHRWKQEFRRQFQ